ncbi:MAG TPA: hypothetical protein VJA94_09350 [Candidatus Angelobacter sp.]
MRSFRVLPLLMLLSCCAAAADQPPCPEPVTHLIVDKGQYDPAPGAVFVLQGFRASLISHGKKQPGCSLRVTRIEHGELLISADSLTKFFDRRIEQTGSKIDNIRVEIKDGMLHLKGKVHKGVGIPFEVEGPVSTDGTNLIVQAKKIKAEGLPMKGLLGMLGVHLSSLINSGKVNGVVADGDKLVFEPLKIANIEGKITKTNLSGNELEIYFGAAAVTRQTATK